MDSGWIPTKHVNNSNSVNTIDTENGDYGTPPPSPILSLYKPITFPTPVCKETVDLLQLILEQAKSGELTGLGLVRLYRIRKYRLDLTGESKNDSNRRLLN